jgi:tetratricopeptide (TPR) repeat protein
MTENPSHRDDQAQRDAIRRRLVELLHTRDPAVRQRQIEASPDLLGEDAQQVLGELADARPLMSEESRVCLDEVIRTISEYREHGLPGAREASDMDGPEPVAGSVQPGSLPQGAPQAEAEGRVLADRSEGAADDRPPSDLRELLEQLREEDPETLSELTKAMAKLLGDQAEGPRSKSEVVEVACDSCQHSFSAETWVIVDAGERPDLAAQCRDGTIHDVECSRCGRACSADAPLLYHDGEAEQLILAAQASTTADEDRAANSRLLEDLYPRLADSWDRDYMDNTRVVPGTVGLKMLLGGQDPGAAIRGMLEQVLGDADTPELARDRLDQLSQVLEGDPHDATLLETAWSFVRAKSWTSSKQILDDNPELLTDEADNVLAFMIGVAQLLDDDSAEVLIEHRELLKRCREIGAHDAFAEKVGMEPADFETVTAAIAGLPPGVLDSAREAFRSAESADDAFGALRENDDVRRALVRAVASADGEEGPDVLLSRGGFLERQGLWEEATDNYVKALAAYEESGDRKGQVKAMRDLANVFSSRGQYDLAVPMYQRAARMAEDLGEALAVAEVQELLAGVHVRRGEYDLAEDLFSRAAVVIEADGDKIDIATLYNNMACLYEERREYAKAESLCQRVISIHAELNQPDLSASTYVNLGAIYAHQDEEGKALEMFQRGLEIQQRLGHEADVAATYNNIAVMHERIKDYPKALEIYQKCLEVCGNLGAEPQLAGLYLNMGGLYAKTGDNNQAVVCLQQSVEISVRIGEKSTEASASFNLGLVYRDRKERDLAARSFKRARDLFAQLGEKQNEALASLNLMILGGLE